MKKFFALVAVAVLVAFAAPALAANPFMDVPMNHWAYDAIGQLASHGIITGYPDGTYKGNQPMTRYELATLVARALAVVDMDKASKQDVEMLKKLVVEFKDELDALGVKVDELDARVAVLEENLGGWKLWGELRMDAKFAGENGQYGDEYTLRGQNEFDLNRYRIWISKQIDENTKFTARLGNRDSAARTNGNAYDGVEWQRYWVDMKLGYDIAMKVGKFDFDWEGDSGIYIDEDAWFGDVTMKGFQFVKDFGMADVTALILRNDSVTAPDTGDHYMFGLRGNFNFNEQFRFALQGLAKSYDDPADLGLNQDDKVYWADFAFNFNPNIAFKGAYYVQDNDVAYGLGVEDSPKAWKAIVDVKQEAFGFTSFWLEYAKLDEGFNVWNANNDGDMYAYDLYGASVLINRNWDETDILFAYLTQKWNDKWTTFERYLQAEYDTVGVDDAKNWTFGVKYQYTPAISFELAYDDVDWGNSTLPGARVNDDHLIRFRTHVKF